MSERVPSVADLRAQAHALGIAAEEADLAGVRDFLAVLLPAVEELAELLPADAPGPAPLDTA